MAQSKKSRASRSDGRKAAIMHRDLAFDPGPTQASAFKRADLVFEGVDHAQGSYEVRVFLNNKKANEETARSPETGYAGRFVVFGHGRCFGEQDHCEPALAAAPAQAIDPGGGHQHPLTPETRILTITEPLAPHPERARQAPRDADLRAGLEGAAARAARPRSRPVQVPPGLVADVPVRALADDPAGHRPLHRRPEGA